MLKFDYIDRESLKNKIMQRLGISSPDYLLQSEKTIWECIVEEPTANVRKDIIAKYVGIGAKDRGCLIYYGWLCSNCKKRFQIWHDGQKPSYNYCPYCGARMEKE